jgi:hypothetical protein
MSEARRKRREVKRLIDKIQAKEKTKYKFEEVFNQVMEEKLKENSVLVNNTSEEISKLQLIKEYAIQDTSK